MLSTNCWLLPGEPTSRVNGSVAAMSPRCNPLPKETTNTLNADWPSDIVVVYMDDSVTALPYDQDITVTGQLEVGSYVDGETGFVSLVRLRGAEVN